MADPKKIAYGYRTTKEALEDGVGFQPGPVPTEMPNIFWAQLEGMLRWYRQAVRDYRDCLVDKAIADSCCSTWEETVDRALLLHRTYGNIVAMAQRDCPQILTDEEKVMPS